MEIKLMTSDEPLAGSSYSGSRLKGLRASASARKQTTVERLRTALEVLKENKKPVSVHTIWEVSGLDYTSYARNPEALALFRSNSTYLKKERKRHREDVKSMPPPPKDPFLNYKRAQLVVGLRQALQRIEELEGYNAQLIQKQVENDLEIAQLKAEITEYRAFLQRFRTDEHNR
jgi:hypothetical protein